MVSVTFAWPWEMVVTNIMEYLTFVNCFGNLQKKKKDKLRFKQLSIQGSYETQGSLWQHFNTLILHGGHMADQAENQIKDNILRIEELQRRLST